MVEKIQEILTNLLLQQLNKEQLNAILKQLLLLIYSLKTTQQYSDPNLNILLSKPNLQKLISLISILDNHLMPQIQPKFEKCRDFLFLGHCRLASAPFCITFKDGPAAIRAFAHLN